MRLLPALGLVAPLLALPALLFALSRGEERFAYPTAPARTDQLVIATPQWEGIRFEFEEAFKKWLYEKDGIGVDVTFIDQGGGTKTIHWIKEQFRQHPAGIGVDLFFGGGSDPYEELKALGLLARAEPANELVDAIPEHLSGSPLRDPDGFWFGACLTSFGIMTNREVMRLVPELRDVHVATWADLGDARFDGFVAGADPRRSSSHHTLYEILLQAHGFVDGMRIARAMGANTRGYSRYSQEIPKQVGVGQAAVAPTIDSFALAMIDEVGDAVTFVLPAGKTLVNADGFAMLRGAPHRDVARRFVEFLLTKDAARLWMLERGEPGGPKRYALNRAAVRPDVYAEVAGRTHVAMRPFEMPPTFRYDAPKAAERAEILNDLLGALLVDTSTELAAATRAARTLDGERRAAAEREIAWLPCGEDELSALARGRFATDVKFREEQRIRWTEEARDHYARAAALAAGARK